MFPVSKTGAFYLAASEPALDGMVAALRSADLAGGSNPDDVLPSAVYSAVVLAAVDLGAALIAAGLPVDYVLGDAWAAAVRSFTEAVAAGSLAAAVELY